MFFLEMAVVVLPQPNELAVSGSITEFAIFFLDLLISDTFPGVGWYQVTHPGSASHPIPTLGSLSDGCLAVLPLLLAVAGQHLGQCLAHENMSCKDEYFPEYLSSTLVCHGGPELSGCQ